MKRSIVIQAARTALIAVAVLGGPARAGVVSIAYSFDGIGNVVGSADTTLTLEALASGSITSSDSALNAAWNPVTYTDEAVLDLTSGLLNGNFTITFRDGSTLLGTVFEDNSSVLASPTQTGPFTQTLTFTGGSGEFANATGFVTGTGFVGATDYTVEGSGAVVASAVPEPESAALVFAGFVLTLGAWRPRPGRRSAARHGNKRLW